MQNAPQELFFLISPNLLTAESPEDITWELAPQGDHGILPPGGNPNVFEEAHVLPLKSGGFWVCGRTSQVHILPKSRYPACTHSHSLIVYRMFAHIWVCGRTSQGFLGASSTRDPTARSGWTTTGVATYWDNRLAPQELRPLPGRKLPGCAPGSCMATGLKSPRGPLTPKRMANGITRARTRTRTRTRTHTHTRTRTHTHTHTHFCSGLS